MAVSVDQRSMWRGRSARWIAAALIIAGVAACALYQGIDGSTKATTEATGEPAVVEQVDGSELASVTLSAAAIERLDLRTVPARTVSVAWRSRDRVPYGAVLYDAERRDVGLHEPEAATFARQGITVDSIDGSRAVLSAGPAAGTQVVTVGAQELWGAELGVDGSGH